MIERIIQTIFRKYLPTARAARSNLKSAIRLVSPMSVWLNLWCVWKYRTWTSCDAAKDCQRKIIIIQYQKERLHIALRLLTLLCHLPCWDRRQNPGAGRIPNMWREPCTTWTERSLYIQLQKMPLESATITQDMLLRKLRSYDYYLLRILSSGTYYWQCGKLKQRHHRDEVDSCRAQGHVRVEAQGGRILLLDLLRSLCQCLALLRLQRMSSWLITSRYNVAVCKRIFIIV